MAKTENYQQNTFIEAADLAMVGSNARITIVKGAEKQNVS